MCDRDVAANDRAARRNREEFHDHHVVAIHLMGSPAAGKTTLLEATVRALAPSAPIGVLAAELATDYDAVRLRGAGAETAAIKTGASCHVDAGMVHRALRGLPWREFAYLFIEDIGNLVCPAIFDLGQDANVVALAATEGADTPLKYPTIFQKADLVLLTKIDLVPEPELVSHVRDSLAAVMPRPALLPLSARTGAGMDRWLRWLVSGGGRRSTPCALGVVSM